MFRLTGAAERALLAAVARRFPELSPAAELSEALQEATEAAERHVARRH